MKQIITLAGMIFCVMCSNIALACDSDFDCDIGQKCVKAPMSSDGTCMKTVDELGAPKLQLPDPNSIQPNTNIEGQCDFSTDCPIGFECDSRMKVCVKR